MSGIRLVALVTCSISFLLIVIGLAIPYWIYVVDKEVSVPGSDTNFTITANIGFWVYCLNIESNGVRQSRCGKFYRPVQSDMTNASAAVLLLGMLMMAGGVLVCGTSVLCMKENKLPLVGEGCALFAGLCMLIGVALYGYEYREEIFIENVDLRVSHMYGPSFYMVIVATVLALVSGGMQLASRTISEMSANPNII